MSWKKLNPEKHKFCWVARETKEGWRMSLAIGDKYNFALTGFYSDEKGIKKILKGNIVFIHKK